MKSTAIKMEVHQDAGYPTVVVCLKEPFKAGFYPSSVDEFENLTYARDKLLNGSVALHECSFPVHVPMKQWLCVLGPLG